MLARDQAAPLRFLVAVLLVWTTGRGLVIEGWTPFRQGDPRRRVADGGERIGHARHGPAHHHPAGRRAEPRAFGRERVPSLDRQPARRRPQQQHRDEEAQRGGLSARQHQFAGKTCAVLSHRTRPWRTMPT
jgi:hypothetical protein